MSAAPRRSPADSAPPTLPGLIYAQWCVRPPAPARGFSNCRGLSSAAGDGCGSASIKSGNEPAARTTVFGAVMEEEAVAASWASWRAGALMLKLLFTAELARHHKGLSINRSRRRRQENIRPRPRQQRRLPSLISGSAPSDGAAALTFRGRSELRLLIGSIHHQISIRLSDGFDRVQNTLKFLHRPADVFEVRMKAWEIERTSHPANG